MRAGVAGIVIVVVVCVCARTVVHLERIERRLAARSSPGVQVVAAARDLRSGHRLSAEDLVPFEMDAGVARRMELTPWDERHGLRGRSLVDWHVAGRPIGRRDFGSPIGCPSSPETGRRWMVLPLPDGWHHSDFSNGHRVDLIGSAAGATAYVACDLEIYSKWSSTVRGHTCHFLTFSVSPEQALLIAAARQAGPIEVVKRGRRDRLGQGPATPKPVTAADLAARADREMVRKAQETKTELGLDGGK